MDGGGAHCHSKSSLPPSLPPVSIQKFTVVLPGQLASTAGISNRRRNSNPTHHCIYTRSTALISPMSGVYDAYPHLLPIGNADDLPDECLAYIFKSLASLDRENCSLVCCRWLRVEGQSRHRLSLKVEFNPLTNVPSLFTRYDAVTTLALKCVRKSRSIHVSDGALVLISLHCRNLTSLNLHSCRNLTDVGMTAVAVNCKELKKLYCNSCKFGAKGVNAVLDHSSSLAELSIVSLGGLTDGSTATPIGLGVAANSLKKISIKKLKNGQCFGPLIIGSKNLRILKISRCDGEWDQVLKAMVEQVTGLIEVHLKAYRFTDVGLAAISTCSNLKILDLVSTYECTNVGLVSIAEHCKLLRKLQIRGGDIGDEGLTAIAKGCPNLEELVLCCVNLITCLSLGLLGSNCKILERLALCWNYELRDAEISCIAAQCIALQYLTIKHCPSVTNHGMEALSCKGCPNLVKVNAWNCSVVTREGALFIGFQLDY
ncbi:F-box protein At1g47056-like [Telopea speciosissima]|uniref:F-box protein At1g47056-like n=1 Tax=Telopea speciosissima TaxID=54955 RepID=UPI001CC38455|nr:F-box protein At1g47056-like [Telopea speciosissima]